MLFGAQAFAGAVAHFHAGQRVGTLPTGGAGSAGALPVEGSGIASRSESVPASPCGGSPSPSLSPSALMTSCAVSSVGDGGRVLRGAAGSAIVVSLCLKAGSGVRMSRGWCVGALVRCSLWGWRMGVPGGDAFRHCEGRLVSGAVPPPAAGVGVGTQHRPHSVRPCRPALLAVG